MKQEKLALPDERTMYNALLEKDSHFEGIFFVGVKTTGIFCRPTCRARKPKLKNIEFFASTKEALLNGYRPCKICNPLGNNGDSPKWLRPLLEAIHKNPELRLRDADLRQRGIDPARVRRWFKKNYAISFQAYMRTLKISSAFSKIKNGDNVTGVAFDSGYESLSGFTESFKKATGFSPIHSRRKNLVTITRIPTPLGPMLAGATHKGICLFEFTDRRMLNTQLGRIRKIFDAEIIPGSSPHFDQLNQEIAEYFEGKRERFTVPLVIDGTPFQEKVWKALRKIPYGETRSYKDQAVMIGHPKAVRAVANANGDNRIAIIIPCHRVIGADGKLVGYGGGLWRKKYLLKLEGANVS